MLMKLGFISTRRAVTLTFLFSVCFFIYTHRLASKLPYDDNSKGNDIPAYQGSDRDPRCRNFPDPGNIAIAVKTGATEAAERIPTQMHTSLRCAQNVMIFSDMEQTIGDYQLYDALDDISETLTKSNPDFDLYRKLKETKNYDQIKEMLKELPDPKISESLAWTLDKYKQLHILEKLYTKHPDKDWYLLMDADTYLVWPNFLLWLEKLGKPSEKMYIGSPAAFGRLRFAHGGSGILMSQATLHDFVVTRNGTAAKMDRAMHKQCCGDLIIGLLFMKGKIILKQSWPTINGEKPLTIPFGEDLWCHPVVTMHHVDSHEMDQIVEFEDSRTDLHVSSIPEETLLPLRPNLYYRNH
jgi:hypothetical protein